MYYSHHIPAGRRGNTTSETLGVVVALTLGTAIGFAILQSGALTTGPANQSIREEAPTVFSNEQTMASRAAATSNPPAAELGKVVADEIRQLKQELLSELREQAASPSASEQGPTATANEYAAAGLAISNSQHAEMGQRTLAYWNQLNDVMLREEQMRQAPLGGLTAANARDFLRRRGRASEFAAESIRSLPTIGVDPEVMALAADISVWYERGNQLNDVGSFLLNEADTTSRRGEPGQQWQAGEKQHIASVAELNQRGDELRRKLIQKYGLPFPDLR